MHPNMQIAAWTSTFVPCTVAMSPLIPPSGFSCQVNILNSCSHLNFLCFSYFIFRFDLQHSQMGESNHLCQSRLDKTIVYEIQGQIPAEEKCDAVRSEELRSETLQMSTCPRGNVVNCIVAL